MKNLQEVKQHKELNLMGNNQIIDKLTRTRVLI